MRKLISLNSLFIHHQKNSLFKNSIGFLTDNKINKKFHKLKIKSSKIAFNLLFLILSSITINQVLSKTVRNRKLISNALKATVKYKGNENQRLYNCGYCDNHAVTGYNRRTPKGTENYNGINLNIAELSWNSLSETIYLFCGCSNIVEIDLSQFNTFGIRLMIGMFKDCTSLVKVTGFVCYGESLGQLFINCISLVSLELPLFGGSNAVHIDNMFNGCKSLVYLNLGNFKGQNVQGMGDMFKGCESLVSLDLSGFTLNHIISMNNVFESCKNLQYINLLNIYTSYSTNIEDIFKGMPQNYVICVTQSKASELFNYVMNSPCGVVDCSGNWQAVQKKLTDDGTCVSDCKSAGKYEYKSICYTKCPNGTLPNTDMMCIDCDLEDNCLWCSLLDALNNLCISCSDGYNEIYNSSKINSTYKKCYNSPEGYYLDSQDSFYKPCYSSCETCSTNGNYEHQNCIKCKLDYFYEIDYINYKNCYQICDYYHYTNITNRKSYCTKEYKCPEEDYIKLITDLKECVIDCNQNVSNPYYEFRNKCYKICPRGLINPRNISSFYCEPKYIYSLHNKTQLILDIQEYLIYVFDGTEVGKGSDLEIQGEGIFVEVTTPQNQKINEKRNNNKTTINLGKCESLLRKENNIYNKNDLFYILKMEIEEQGMRIPIIDYEVYYPLNSPNLEKLNLSVCENTQIDLSIPVKLDHELFKHNASSDYYNNKCFTTKSKGGTDICLKDRQNEFIEQNLTLCEENCILVNFDFNTNKSKCKCDVKINIPVIKEEIKIDKEKLKKNFKDVKGYFTNIDVVKCYKKAFQKMNIIKNLGFYISLFELVLLFICLILFYHKYYKKLKLQIISIVIAIKYFNKSKEQKEKIPLIKQIKNLNTNINNIQNDKTNKIKTNINNNNINPNSQNLQKSFQGIIKSYSNNNNNNNSPFIQSIKLNKKEKSKTINKVNNILNIKNQNQIITSSQNKLNKKQKNNIHNNTLFQKYKDILEYNDNEKNSLAYKEALKYDKRTYLQYYISLLKIKNLFLFSFFPNHDYNSRIIKIFLFFFSFYIDLTVNALYYNDDTMHQIYKDEGKFNFIYQLPQIVVSSLISCFASSIVSYLSLSEDDILKIKKYKNKDAEDKEKEKEKYDLDEIKQKVFKKLKIKFGLFFFVTNVIIIVFGFYLSCFCYVYKNTQIHLIKDTGLSFAFALIVPFLTSLLPGLLRIHALRDKKGNRNIMYKLSTIIESI